MVFPGRVQLREKFLEVQDANIEKVYQLRSVSIHKHFNKFDQDIFDYSLQMFVGTGVIQ